jgi:hypothetical protein
VSVRFSCLRLLEAKGGLIEMWKPYPRYIFIIWTRYYAPLKQLPWLNLIHTELNKARLSGERGDH